VDVTDGTATRTLQVLSHQDTWLRVELDGVQHRLLLLDDGERLHLALAA
jgi:hypothetical protein